VKEPKWHYFDARDDMCVDRKYRFTYCGRDPFSVERTTPLKLRVTCLQCLRMINLFPKEIDS
jgi:hypothetical protein